MQLRTELCFISCGANRHKTSTIHTCHIVNHSASQSVSCLGIHLTQNVATGWTAFTCSCYVGYNKARLSGDALLGLFNLCFRQQRSKLFWRLRLSMQATTATASNLRKGCACLPRCWGYVSAQEETSSHIISQVFPECCLETGKQTNTAELVYVGMRSATRCTHQH